MWSDDVGGPFVMISLFFKQNLQFRAVSCSFVQRRHDVAYFGLGELLDAF